MIQLSHFWVFNPKNMKTLIRKDIHTSMFIAALFSIAKIWKQPKCPTTDEWIKMWYFYSMEYYSVIKKVNSCHLLSETSHMEINTI